MLLVEIDLLTSEQKLVHG